MKILKDNNNDKDVETNVGENARKVLAIIYKNKKKIKKEEKKNNE